MTKGTETIAGFLSAVRDCCTEAGKDAQVPSSVIDRLNRLLDAQNSIPDETSKQLEFVAKKLVKVA